MTGGRSPPGSARPSPPPTARTPRSGGTAWPRSSPATVSDQLATVALANVPDGSFDSIEPAEYGDDKVAVFVHYDTDLTLVTYLILDGTGWRIYAYDRWEE